MKYRLVTLISFFVTVTAIAFTTHHLSFSSKPPVVHAKLSPKLLSYLGVYEPGSPPAYRPVGEFAAMANRRPNLVGYYSGWAEPFNRSFADMMHQHGVTPYVQIDPTLARFSAIPSGAYDSYLRSYADSVRDYGHAVVIGFGHEMNAPWYSWGYGTVPAKTFVAAWRHIVTVFNSEGARNVTWLWTINQDLPGTGRHLAAWWPGPKYVTWVGIDGYYYYPSETFFSIFGKTIADVRTLTGLPVLLSEVAVGPRAGQDRKIPDLFAGMRQYGTLGLVWFDIAQHNGVYHQDWRIEDNQAAEMAFRRGASALNLVRP